MRCSEYESLTLIDSFTPSKENAIYAKVSKELDINQTFILNPTDNQYTDYYILIVKSNTEKLLVNKIYPYFYRTHIKIIPGFLEEIELNESWNKTDYIIDLLGIGSGFLIIFNIDGIPKFCITGSDVLSDQVRNKLFIKYINIFKF